ncbi:MAG TPA: TIGR01777 family oxidoreductase [Vicinamibacterales bacterium]|nr:TIGR01777 family oxidoreductase [Vicinamibacterales bacterium]
MVSLVKVVIPGGSGHLGHVLARSFARDGHDVVILSRRRAPLPWRVVEWDAASLGAWTAELEGADVLINLAGRSVNCRYTPARRREILDSRVVSTRVLGEAVARASRPPRVWLQSSTATIYAHRFDAANDEATGILGGSEPGVPDTWNFSIDVATKWEREFDRAPATPDTRKVAMRSAIVMSPERDGPFEVLLQLVRRGLGGTSGDGRQFVSWIHDEDFVRAVKWLIDRADISGVVNLAAPNPLPNAEFMRALRDAWGTSMGLPAPAWLLEIGALFMRTETELVLKSRRVVSARLRDHGFVFSWPQWPEAARDLVKRWRSRPTADSISAP